MATLNMLQLISMLRNGNPQAVAEQIIQQNYPNDPTMQQLLSLGRQGDSQQLHQFAQQLFAQSGRDFDKEYQSFMGMLKGM